MFLALLAVTFVISLLSSFVLARIFSSPLEAILHRIISDDISAAWLKYLKFAIYVVGISSGVRIWELEKYITPQPFREPLAEPLGGPSRGPLPPLVLNTDRWVLEVYRTVIGTLQGVAWMLLVFFVFALLAYVVVRISETRRAKSG